MKIFLARKFADARELLLRLKDQNGIIIGFDTEATCAQRVSLIQVATHECCYLIQIGVIYDEEGSDIVIALEGVLSNPNIIKVGIGLEHDAELLRKHYGLVVRGGIDLQTIARTLSVPDVSLDGLGHKYLPNFPGKDKLGHKGDWDGPLDQLQQHYAAMDAYYSLMIYLHMMKLPLPTEKVCDDERDLYGIWIRNYLSSLTTPISFKSLVNYSINSYGPWRKKYFDSERIKKATDYLTGLKEELRYDPKTDKFPNIST